MKKYFVQYYKEFSNTFNLAWAETSEQVEQAHKAGYKQISRREAENLCRSEAKARVLNPQFSGYGDVFIFPINYNRAEKYWENDRNIVQNGYILNYIN